MKILFELTFNKGSVTTLLEYNRFDYCVQVLFVNVTHIFVNINASYCFEKLREY